MTLFRHTCLLLVIFTAGSAHLAAHEPPRAPNGPLVLEFELDAGAATLKQQIVVSEGAQFAVATYDQGIYWRVTGKVETIVDGVAPVYLVYQVGRGLTSAGSYTTLEPRRLKIDEYRGGGECTGIHVMICNLWIRRGLDPLPVLTTAVAERREHWEASVCQLGALRAATEPAVTELIKVLTDKSLDAPDSNGKKSYLHPRRWAAEALGEIGVANDAVISALIEAARDPNAYIRLDAAEALWKLARHAESVPTAVAALDDENHFVRSAAARLLETIAPDAPEVVAKLRALFEDDDDFVRIAAACAVWKISHDRAALGVLRNVRDTAGQAPSRSAAAQCLRSIKTDIEHRQREAENHADRGQ